MLLWEHLSGKILPHSAYINVFKDCIYLQTMIHRLYCDIEPTLRKVIKVYLNGHVWVYYSHRINNCSQGCNRGASICTPIVTYSEGELSIFKPLGVRFVISIDDVSEVLLVL